MSDAPAAEDGIRRHGRDRGPATHVTGRYRTPSLNPPDSGNARDPRHRNARRPRKETYLTTPR
ncbi:hypothetical protein MBEHAL_0254 [Halarchaeum acidiphilum MH1-52-1]|uniref:Uncharacterized protein n=1 Tax=Halarchaeum acidiphilum MH1-52-1 TaxID=1261545 RepID=U3A1H0_9EURY|nr:hypothetical protein MBEHAL_0254 [Halarchaeum acidiphilum MH1-52-1]